MVEITNLLYEVEDKILFDNASIKISEGKYCLTGNNGVGKSSLLNLITKNSKPDAGEIKIDCDYIYITQTPNLLYKLRVLANLNFFNSNNKNKIISNLELRGINLKNKLNSLSGGQIQLVYLEICLQTDYELYIIDEPFNNLDKNNVDYIKELIDSKKNVIVVDHLNKFNYTNIKIEMRGLKCEA